MRYVITFYSGDVRECELDGDVFVHVLNTSYRIHRDDKRIVKIRRIEC
jgi:hypothetical protein